ncbi:hypothetical protein D3C85_1658450 [compost metagenome]
MGLGRPRLDPRRSAVSIIAQPNPAREPTTTLAAAAFQPLRGACLAGARLPPVFQRLMGVVRLLVEVQRSTLSAGLGR